MCFPLYVFHTVVIAGVSWVIIAHAWFGRVIAFFPDLVPEGLGVHDISDYEWEEKTSPFANIASALSDKRGEIRAKTNTCTNGKIAAARNMYIGRVNMAIDSVTGTSVTPGVAIYPMLFLTLIPTLATSRK